MNETQQQYVKVDGRVEQNIPAGPFIAGAYGFVWVAVLAYVMFIARGLGSVRAEVEELRRRISKGNG